MTAKQELVARLKARLNIVRNEICAAIENGTAYSLSGSHSKTSISFDSLKKEESALVIRIARLCGAGKSCSTMKPAFFDA